MLETKRLGTFAFATGVGASESASTGGWTTLGGLQVPVAPSCLVGDATVPGPQLGEFRPFLSTLPLWDDSVDGLVVPVRCCGSSSNFSVPRSEMQIAIHQYTHILLKLRRGGGDGDYFYLIIFIYGSTDRRGSRGKNKCYIYLH